MKIVKNNNGTTLIEILVSMVIIAITALGGVALYFNSGEVKSMAVHKKMATEIASSKLEELKYLGYSDPALNVGVTTSDVSIGGLSANVADGNGMTVTVTDTGSGYKQVQVDIDWNEVGRMGQDKNVSLMTFVRP